MTLPMTSFKLYGRQLIASQTEGGRLRIEGVASSTIRDTTATGSRSRRFARWR